MASAITLSASVTGIPQSVQRQVRQAQQALNRRPLTLKLDPKGFKQPLGRITGDLNEFQKSLDASVARTFAFGAAVGVVSKVSDAFIRSTNNKHTLRYKELWREQSYSILLIQLLHNIKRVILTSHEIVNW